MNDDDLKQIIDMIKDLNKEYVFCDITTEEKNSVSCSKLPSMILNHKNCEEKTITITFRR